MFKQIQLTIIDETKLAKDIYKKIKIELLVIEQRVTDKQQKIANNKTNMINLISYKMNREILYESQEKVRKQ